MYTAGWIASGPIGVIASTMQRAYAVASTILTDHYQSPGMSSSGTLLNPLPDMMGTPEFITKADKRVVELEDWKRIDQVEVRRGEEKGKVREKFTSIGEMLRVLD
jgi:adrenodoxin-NADP+ reductase